MSLTDDYLAWRRTSAVGCGFARSMAFDPGRYGQRVELIAGAQASTLAQAVESRLAELIANSAVQAAALICAEISLAEQLVALAAELERIPLWSVRRWHIAGTPIGDAVAFGVVREIPFRGGTCPSEMLALAPFINFPNTRKAPVTALEIFVGVPPQLDPKTNQPTVKANLAHVDMQLPTQIAHEKMWKNSIAGRKRSLGCEDDRAKAKVTFAIPEQLAATLGCKP